MREIALTAQAREARNKATLNQADAGSLHAGIHLFTQEGGDLLAVASLAKPCGELTSTGRMKLFAGAGNDLVLDTGAATWGVWKAGDGTPIAQGPVTDETGKQGGPTSMTDSGNIGPWVLQGTQGTQLYAGGIVALHTAVIG